MNEAAEKNDMIPPEETSVSADAEDQGHYDIDLILDIPLNLSVELGKVKMLVNDLLQLGQGSVIELAKSVSDPLDIYVNDKLIAKGEVVVMEDRFGIRVSEIINPADRVKSLG